ncbi:Bgt-2086, partial [Blumeria graminis f. sp. tritici]
IGKLTHYAFDAVLISTILAGVKRSTGLTLNPSLKKDTFSTSSDMSGWIEKYLGVGEWVMDQSVAIAGSSGWFERKR